MAFAEHQQKRKHAINIEVSVTEVVELFKEIQKICSKHMKCPVLRAHKMSALRVDGVKRSVTEGGGPMKLYTLSAVERAMKLQEVVLLATGGRLI